MTAIKLGCLVLAAGTANADVSASVGRRISVSGCTSVVDPVNVCVGVGRRIHVGGCN